MKPEPVVHTVGNSQLAPSLQARQVANRLDSLEPLEIIDGLLETLAKAEKIMTKKAMEREETSNLVAQLRLQNQRRRTNRKGA